MYGHGDGIPDATDRTGKSLRRVGCRALHTAVRQPTNATHGPSARLSVNHNSSVWPSGEVTDACACAVPLRQLLRRVRPAVHVFGHIHEDHGVTSEEGIYFVNAASCNTKVRGRGGKEQAAGHILYTLPVTLTLLFVLRSRG